LRVVGLVEIGIPLVTDERKARNTNIVQGCIVAALIPFHPWLNQAQIRERHQGSADSFPRGIILVESQRLDTRSPGVVCEDGGNLAPFRLVLFHVFARAHLSLFLSRKQNNPDRTLGLQLQSMRLAIVDRCRCGDDFWASFHTTPESRSHFSSELFDS
jgi:hypothetical protein